MPTFDISREISSSGEFVRQQSCFREFVTADGSSGFKAEPGRYHLYVSYACPWASRSIIFRKLKGLEDVISMTVVDPVRDDRGWRFFPGEPDPVAEDLPEPLLDRGGGEVLAVGRAIDPVARRAARRQLVAGARPAERGQRGRRSDAAARRAEVHSRRRLRRDGRPLEPRLPRG